MKIPKTIFYIFGIDSSFCNKPFSYFHYLNIKSAAIINPEYKIQLYFKYRPRSDWFDKLTDFCELIEIQTILDDGIKFAWTEHIGDYIRLNTLYNNGGIYLDIDTVCVKSFDDLLSYECVMGKEYGIREGESNPSLIGLCNATMIGIAQNRFMKIWIDDYHTNYKSDWNYNSVQIPYKLAETYPELIHVLEAPAFFKYSWDNKGKKQLFELSSDVSDCYSIHLWESKNFNILNNYTPKIISDTNNTVCNIYKQII